MTIMTNMSSLDHHVQRRIPFPTGPTSHPIQSNGYLGPQTQNNGYLGSQAQALRASPYMGNGIMQHGHGDSVANLAHGFGAMGLHQSSVNRSSLPVGPAATMANEYSASGVMHSQAGYYGQQMNYGHLVHNSAAPQGLNAMHQGGNYMQPGPQNVYMPQMGLETAQSPQTVVPYHADNHWNARIPSGASQAMPTLVNTRRNSLSSNEEHIPSTPFHHYGYGDVAILERSPGGVFASNTPSPASYNRYGVQSMVKNFPIPPMPVHFRMLLKRDPEIPRAIPAPSSPAKPLDRCLENKNGETNVYIRGLLPETTDDMLHAWGARFGDIASSKSIIDHKTGLCKGFGFVKYHNFEDAEACIRGFHYLGYEVSFARESFYSKLKKFADEANTNLYVSNIPRNFNEHELSNCFQPFKVCSARILRDDRGNGRGVGFARFETRDVCEEIIKTFNNTMVSKPGGEEYTIQIRYSDTHEQKMLKQQTAAARNFRAAEFEYGCIQAQRSGLLPSSSERAAGSLVATPTSSVTNVNDDFESYMQANPYGHATTATSRATVARTSLPTINSERSASPQVLAAGTGAFEGNYEEGVALPAEIIEARTRSPSPARAVHGLFPVRGADSE